MHQCCCKQERHKAVACRDHSVHCPGRTPCSQLAVPACSMPALTLLPVHVLACHSAPASALPLQQSGVAGIRAAIRERFNSIEEFVQAAEAADQERKHNEAEAAAAAARAAKAAADAAAPVAATASEDTAQPAARAAPAPGVQLAAR